MKRNIFYGIICGIVLSLSIFTFVYSSSVEKKSLLSRVITFDYALAAGENSKDDEKNSSETGQVCSDGSVCECVLCEKGNTDCSPTCPCCPQ
jgi:hypothetical protein